MAAAHTAFWTEDFADHNSITSSIRIKTDISDVFKRKEKKRFLGGGGANQRSQMFQSVASAAPLFVVPSCLLLSLFFLVLLCFCPGISFSANLVLFPL